MKVYKIRYKMTKKQQKELQKESKKQLTSYLQYDKVYLTRYKAQKALESLKQEKNHYIVETQKYFNFNKNRIYIKELEI